MNNKLQQTGSNIAEVLIVVAILALVNWLGYKFFTRWDFTQNKQYTVSQATKDVLGRLNDPINVTVYMSSELPPQMTSIRRTLRDTLDEYSVYGKGKFRVRYVDPKDDTKLKEKAQNEGVPEVEIQVMEKDAFSTKKIYFGLVMSLGSKSEVVSTGELAQAGALEYSLTNRVLRLQMDKKPRIGLFEGSFVANQQQQAPTYQFVNQFLGGAEGLYEIVRIDPRSDQRLPDDLAGVLMLGTFNLSQGLKYSVDQYLLQGGQVLVAIDPMMDLRQMQQQGGDMAQAYPSLPSYEPELEKYGVRLEKKLVVEAETAFSAQAPMRAGFMTLMMQYPLWPKIGPLGFNPDIAAVARLESFVLPFCCPMLPAQVAGVEYQPLLTTSKNAFVYSSPFNLEPRQDWGFLATKSETRGPFTIGVLLSGKFPTAFPDGPPELSPPPPDAGAEGVTPASIEQFDASAQVKEGNGEGRLMVISSAQALNDQYLQQFNENALFLANTVDTLAFGDELLGIRSAPVTQRPLVQLSDSQKQLARWGNVLGVPLLLTLLGLLLWVLKGRRRAAMQAKYSGS